MTDYSLARVTTGEFARAVSSGAPLVILLPVGSVEPHGPHLGLLTDTIISQASAQVAARVLEAQGTTVFIAPAVPYGVTDFAAGFKGAISIPASILTAYLEAVAKGFLDNGAAHVCLVNNHLEPGHYQAILAAAQRFAAGQCSVACPLSRRWARTLSEEFKRGECHAGRYETALMLAAEPGSVRREIQASLPEVPISLSDSIKAGVRRFTEMGMDSAYAGAPALATEEEGRELLERLATMIVAEVTEGMAQRTAVTKPQP
ncbi:MAG TPA: creatininase family protein [Candidatus Binatia bacterium]|nr:creatininase family protein [Candidatus Binatia bacterium]